MSNVSGPGKKVVFSDEILQDPYPTYARMHEEGPLHYIDAGGKWAVWAIFSHAECASIAKDPRLSAKRAQQMLLPLPFSRQSEFSDFFSTLFGGGEQPYPGAAGTRRRNGRDQHASIDVDLEEAHRGVVREVTLQQSAAAGTPAERTLRVTLPAGVIEGPSLRLAGQGEPASGKGARAGDLYLTVHIRPHRNLELDGRDVRLTLPVAPWEAALGATLQVPTLGGPVDLRIPPQSQSGSRLRLRGRGLAGDPPGDQYVVLKVVLPPADTAAARELYEKMKSELAFDPRANL